MCQLWLANTKGALPEYPKKPTASNSTVPSASSPVTNVLFLEQCHQSLLISPGKITLHGRCCFNHFTNSPNVQFFYTLKAQANLSQLLSSGYPESSILMCTLALQWPPPGLLLAAQTPGFGIAKSKSQILFCLKWC